MAYLDLLLDLLAVVAVPDRLMAKTVRGQVVPASTTVKQVVSANHSNQQFRRLAAPTVAPKALRKVAMEAHQNFRLPQLVMDRPPPASAVPQAAVRQAALRQAAVRQVPIRSRVGLVAAAQARRCQGSCKVAGVVRSSLGHRKGHRWHRLVEKIGPVWPLKTDRFRSRVPFDWNARSTSSEFWTTVGVGSKHGFI